MWYVYILRSEGCDDKFYTGLTNNLERRLREHNSEGNTGYTKRYQPWALHVYTAFKDRKLVEDFEKYLKTQAGRRFQKLRLQYRAP